MPRHFGRGKWINDAMTGLPGRRPRVKLSKDEILRRLRLRDLRRLLGDRCRGSVLPDDDAGREYLVELLLPISLGPNEAIKSCRAVEIWGPTDRMRREIELWAPWMSEDETGQLLIDINLMPAWQRKPMARTLGERLQVTYAQRARLQLRTIGPCDMTEAAMALIRKQKKRQRDKLRRQSKGAISRTVYLANHRTSKEQPWLVLKISRATWYRRIKQEQANETGPRQVNLTKTALVLVSKEKHGSNAGECVRVSTATPAGLVQTCAEFLTADEASWLVDAICPPGESVGYEAAA
jgi:hypothetical protein